jgi:hypothetical protein
MNTAQHKFAGYPPAIREALEVRAEMRQQLHDISAWLLDDLTKKLAEAVEPQEIADLWRDHALLVRRAAKQWEKAQAAVIEALGDEPREVV